MFGFSGTCPDFHPNAIWTVTVSGKIMASVPPGWNRTSAQGAAAVEARKDGSFGRWVNSEFRRT